MRRSQVASHGGRRLKLRYLGTAKNNAWLKNRTGALNLRNLINRGLNRANGAMGAGLTGQAPGPRHALAAIPAACQA